MLTTFKDTYHHWFVPGSRNDHHAPVIAHTALTLYLCLAIAGFVILGHLQVQTGDILGFATDVSADRLLSLTNAQRDARGLPPLSHNDQLSTAARAKAEDMLTKNYWAHFGPNGESPWTFIQGTGYLYETAGENLAKNYVVSADVVDAWMASPTHRDNVLNASYEDVGYAVVNGSLGGEDTTLVVQMFGSRSALVGVAAAVTLTPIPSPSPSTFNLQPSTTSTPPPSTLHFKLATTPRRTAPSINLYPAFKLILSILVGCLLIAFVIDLYHISKTAYTHHRGKHIVHILFLFAILTAMFFLGRGSIL